MDAGGGGAHAPGRVEVAVHSQLLTLSGCSNLSIRGLRFQHDGSFLLNPQRAALRLSNCRQVLIEDCVAELNNAKGLQIDGASNADITLRRVRCSNNGFLGILASRSTNLRLEECDTSGNNWRGAWAGSYRRSCCGIKIMHTRGLRVVRHRSIGNLATGIWLDEDNHDVHISDCQIYGNYRGLHLEASDGPVEVVSCQIVANRQEPRADQFRWAFGSGIVLTHLANARIEHCLVADNDLAQIGVRDDRPTRTLVDAASGERSVLHTEHTVLRGNTIIAGGPSRALLHWPDAQFDAGRAFRTLTSDQNHYHRPGGRNGFLVGRCGARGPAHREMGDLAFSAWQRLTGQDRASTYQD